MQIVIEIPDEEYKDVKKAGGCYYDFGKAIFYGTPLPKNHGRLIDADEYVADIKKHYFDNDTVIRCAEIAIDNAPTIIEADAESEEV